MHLTTPHGVPLTPFNIWANRSQQLFLEQLLQRWASRQGFPYANGAADGLQVVPSADPVMPDPGTPEYEALVGVFRAMGNNNAVP